MRAIRKNRREIGIRAESLLVNPHSNGLSLLRSEKAFFLKERAKSLTTSLSVKAVKKTINNIRIRKNSDG